LSNWTTLDPVKYIMNGAYLAYRCLSTGLFFTVLPPALLASLSTDRWHDSLLQRMGIYPPELKPFRAGVPRIWIHAVSVGEVGVAATLLDRLTVLVPEAAMVISTATHQGWVQAREKLGKWATCIFAPVDAPVAVARALKNIRPDVLVCLETEIWPNLLMTAKQMGVATALVNGRISKRSIRGYGRVRCLLTAVLQHVDAFSMIGPGDARRIRWLGAPADRIEVKGNAKFDALLSPMKPGVPETERRRFNLSGTEPVLVAGSTRHGEEDILLKVFEAVSRRFPDAVMILAPRHIQRAAGIEARVRQMGFACQRCTDLDRGVRRQAPVIVLDTIGHLSDVYSIATVVFCGGSLVPLGGQNLLEPALWGKPVFFGPCMDDFHEARDLIEEAGGGETVTDGNMLAQRVMALLAYPQQAHNMGDRAKAAVISQAGAADRHASVIASLLTANR
jgi:3-deoxy-D-manno-octulosonic-acid transferase